jgi:hypothetical protein
MALGRRLYFGALLAVLIATAGGVLCNGLFFLTQPYQLNYGEGLVAWQAAHITDPARAYRPLTQYPFVVFQYPPLYHLTARAMAALSRTDLLAAGRAVSLISAALLCAATGWITYQILPRRANPLGRLFAAALAGGIPTVFYNFDWAWLARVDVLAVLLSFSGVALFAARSGSVPAQIFSSVLMTAALFTRQTMLAAPIACLLIALVIDRRAFRRMLITMGVLGGSGLGWLEWWTDRQALLHLIRYNQAEFSVLRAGQGLLMNIRHMAGPLFLACAASYPVLRIGGRLAHLRRWDLLGAHLRVNGYRRSVVLFAVYGLLAGLISLTFGKQGSDINYFLDWNMSMAPLTGILLFRAVDALGRSVRLHPLSVAALLVPLLLLEQGFDRARDGWIRALHGPLPADREKAEIYQRMLATIQNTSAKPVFSEDMNLLYKAGKEIPAEPAMIQCLATAGIWDETPFVRMILGQRFAMIVAQGDLSPERYSPTVAAAISSSYALAWTAGEYRLYKPQEKAGN